VAHELRTPLTALGLVTESLALSPNKKQSVQIERLQRELNRLQQLVSDLLELSRIENKSLSNGDQPQSVELHELVIQAWQSLVPLAEQRGVDLVLDSGGQHRVRGDADRLHRVLLNLLDNALRFSPDQGEIQVRLYREGNWQRLEVRDQGEGFSDEDLQHMYERFYRGDPSRSRGKRVGSGLGLAIVDQITSAHGGRIRARNHLEGGAQLLLDLPTEP
jgi:two-component system phosphate regulon sensor histidine kinase PhoR